ncbi:energy transducer TonB [Pelagicoccus sp. SDUM812003]|uniref:energy transducer TonB family protein n=1 Tax=Pelagicoccus sp. SDUM812003 TaxID=3041267 RepID=UPI00280F3628|nr:energy transducer TonB [Pelagicoccus sp. SDUM812003]MDQ8203046.1 energy transducer TonB [Pelagicoccus sp. SDUM812003]
MKTRTLRYLSLFLAVATLCGSSSIADTLTTSAGASYDGRIYKILEQVVYMKVGEETVEVALADLDAASKAAAQAWADENPQSVDVYTKWDTQPRIKSSAMPFLPEEFHNPEFKGMVAVDLVLNEAGQVIHASVKKSTHEGLEAPSLEAAKTWIFEPAQVGGKPVKSKLRVPFKFVYTPTDQPAG